jgi:hypothetical protein
MEHSGVETKNGAPEEDSVPTIPRWLYRYRAFQDEHDSLRSILKKNRWYFGSRASFDDHEDCVVPGIVIDRRHSERVVRTKDGGMTPERQRQIAQLLADPLAPSRITADVQHLVDHVGILCLSELDDDPELWRLYADDGRGVCLRLDAIKVAEAEPYRLHGPFEVTYCDDPKQAWDPHGDIETQTEVTFLQKRTIWGYQKEWRFIMHDGDRRSVGDQYAMPPDALVAVILGRRLTEAQCREVVRWVRSGPWNPMPEICCREPAQAQYLL